MRKVSITVLRKAFYPEYADAYLSAGRAVGPCPLLEAGDTFLYEGSAQMPDGFCPWAWIDRYGSVSAMSSGSSLKPWTKVDGQTVVCCTDGIRPVIFHVEALEDQGDAVE